MPHANKSIWLKALNKEVFFYRRVLAASRLSRIQYQPKFKKGQKTCIYGSWTNEGLLDFNCSRMSLNLRHPKLASLLKVFLLQGVSLKIEQLLRMMSDEEKPPAPPLRNTSNQGHNKVRHSVFSIFENLN